MIREWTLAKLEAVKDRTRVLLRDPIRLLQDADSVIHRFARENNYTVIVASTNLVFRELYEKIQESPDAKKILVIDRATAKRNDGPADAKAPPPFYPDFIQGLPGEAIIDLDLCSFLREETGDPNWPYQANDPQYSRLIVRYLGGVLKAHKNLRNANSSRFTDPDFKEIVSYAALGVADAAFKKLNDEEYWKIGLFGYDSLERLKSLAPEITNQIKEKLKKAKPPFRWLAENDPETVIRAFYLSVILSQHIDNWNLLLANIDPALKPFSDIKEDVLNESAPKLVLLDPDQAGRDLDSVEQSLGKDALKLILIDQIKLGTEEGFTKALENEKYSTLIRSLALLMALDGFLSGRIDAKGLEVVKQKISAEYSDQLIFVEKRPSSSWVNLKEAFDLALNITPLQNELSKAVKNLKVLKPDQLSLAPFRELWNSKKINRLEYYVSSLERLVQSSDLLPRAEDELPSIFSNALQRIKEKTSKIGIDTRKSLDELNLQFQGMIAKQYPGWVAKEDGPILTSQFIRRCLKPNWDAKNEKAVVFVFDGMRYDIWDEMVRPAFEERLVLLNEYDGLSLLPSETHITRKAICAGTYADSFNSGNAENALLKEALSKEMGLSGDVDVLSPEGHGTGETVRYRAGNLDVYIFELCDSELHDIRMKKYPDGRELPSRPLSFIYQQLLKNVIDNEVMSIVRSLTPGTKVFVTADHGFTIVGRQSLWIDETWVNDKFDCFYQYTYLKDTLTNLGAPTRVRDNVWEYSVSDLRLPNTENKYQAANKPIKKFVSVIFPKTGYAFSRPNSPFNPDAFSHGGISIQELLIPMAVMKVKPQEEGLLNIEEIIGPNEAVEGEEISFIVKMYRMKKGDGQAEDIRVDVDASYNSEPEPVQQPTQVLFVASKGTDCIINFNPDTSGATPDERREGIMKRTLTVTATYREGHRTRRKTVRKDFAIQLNSEQVVRRVPTHLGNILGLTPKSMR